jgi:hypothetical protein
MLEEGVRMRIFLPALLLALALSGSAGAATRNFGITSFDRIRVDGPYKVKLTTGVAPYASASGTQQALDGVAVDVQGRTLVVHSNPSSWSSYPDANNGPVEISLGTHELSAARLNGSGSLQISKVKSLSFDLAVQGSGAASIGQTDVDQLSVALAGSASAVLAGRSGKMSAVLRGISSLDASALVTKDAAIGADGAATVKANITNAVKIDGSGPATIALSGRPSCTSKLSGSASVSGCR